MSSSARKGFFRTNCCLLPSRTVLAQDNCKHPDNHCHAAADLDNRVLPGNTLILELTDGLYIWPPSSHIRRTASGAVPSSIPEPASISDGEACTSHQECHIEWPYISRTMSSELAESMVHSSVLPCPRQLLQRIQWARPADGLQDPTSRSSKAPQLPAIAEEPGAGAPQREPDRKVAGAATKVTAQALESSLRAAIEAQRRLRARRKHRDKLLHALGKVTCPCPKLVTLQMQLICLSGRTTLMDGPSITESCPEACLCVREVKCEQLLAGRQALAGVWRGTRPTDVAAA